MLALIGVVAAGCAPAGGPAAGSAPAPTAAPIPAAAVPTAPRVPATTAPTAGPPAPPAAPGGGPVSAARPTDSTASAPSGLPPIPAEDGPLQVRVVYPGPNQTLTSRDSNFIFGSVGTGRAKLTINGAPVTVYPNGAFLAWLPVPQGDKPHYELNATKGAEFETVSLAVTLRPTPMILPDTGRLVVDRASLFPSARLTLRPDDRVRVGLRAPANVRVTLHTGDGATHTLSHTASVNWATEVAARELARGGTIVVRRGTDSADVRVAPVALNDPNTARHVELLNANPDAHSDTDQVAILRPSAGGTYKWFLFPGTVVEVTGQIGDQLRVKLDDQLDAWVEERAVRSLPDSTFVPRRVASNARVATGAGFTDLRIPVTGRTPYLVEEVSSGQLRLTLYGVTSNVDIVNFATNDPTIRDVTWEQVTSDRVRFTVELRHEPYGYLALWERGAFVLRVRRPPVVNADRPLAGRIIAIDPGHPPIGSTGPTGFYEADAVLAVAQQLKPMLESRGAIVVMTRTAPGPVPLGDRAIIARRAGAELLVSIHLNALPDGANPFRAATGSGTYFFLPHAERLARAVQRGLVREMGLRDLGINYDNLAVARFTWAPAILCEGAFIIMPEQESALRTAEFQRKYAQGIVDGVEEYFASMARR